MNIRKSQVEKIKSARASFVSANDDPDATREDRRKATAILDALRRTSSPGEHLAGYAAPIND